MWKRGFAVIRSRRGYRLAAVKGRDVLLQQLDEGPDLLPDLLADRMVAFAEKHQLSRRVLLAVDAHDVLVGSVEIPPGGRQDRRTLSYQLEGVLPIAAEQVAADFIAHAHQVLGIALPIDRWVPLVSTLERRGFRIQAIVPLELLALESVAREHAIREADLVVWQTDDELAWFEYDQRWLVGWHVRSAEQETVAVHMAATLLHHRGTVRVALIHVAPPIREAFEADNDVEITVIETESLEQHAARGADLVLSGSQPPVVDLRRDRLAMGDPLRHIRGSLTLFAASLCLFLIVLAGALLWRASQYRQEADQMRAEQAAAFQRVLPDSPVPVAIIARLRSEQAKLRGGRGADDLTPPARALPLLHGLLRTMPDSIRFQLRELRIEQREFDLDMDFRTLGDVNRFVSALRDGGFVVEAPSSIQRPGNVISTRIHGYRPEGGEAEALGTEGDA